MYLTIHERKIRNQEAAVRNLANKYLDIEVGISEVIKQIESEWQGAGADSQIQKLRNTLKEANTTRMELLNVASLLDQYCISHRTVWEELKEVIS